MTTTTDRAERIRQEIAEIRDAGLTIEAFEAIRARHPEDVQAIAYGLSACGPRSHREQDGASA